MKKKMLMKWNPGLAELNTRRYLKKKFISKNILMPTNRKRPLLDR